MFTGIITAIGKILNIAHRDTAVCLTIEVHQFLGTTQLGDSIAVNGCCLTVTDLTETTFTVLLSSETLAKTGFSDIEVGHHVNLEQSVTVGQALSGHWVTGHVDGLAECTAVYPEGACRRIVFTVPAEFAHFIAAKGSITLDGVSLTVNKVKGKTFEVMIIEHTLTHTTLGDYDVGRRANFEIDILARYIARYCEVREQESEHAFH